MIIFSRGQRWEETAIFTFRKLLSGKVTTAENIKVLIGAESISRKKHEQKPGEGFLWLQWGISPSQQLTYSTIWTTVFDSVYSVNWVTQHRRTMFWRLWFFAKSKRKTEQTTFIRKRKEPRTLGFFSVVWKYNWETKKVNFWDNLPKEWEVLVPWTIMIKVEDHVQRQHYPTAKRKGEVVTSVSFPATWLWKSEKEIMVRMLVFWTTVWFLLQKGEKERNNSIHFLLTD